MKIYVAHSSDWDYKELLYMPIKKSDILNHHDVILPHDEESKVSNSKEAIKKSDLMIAEVSMQSTGMGIEMGWAEIFDVPILCIYRKGEKYSSAVKFITQNIIEYCDENDMINKIKEFLESIK